MFSLSTEPLDPARLKQGLPDPTAGAIATFEGAVRNHNEGKSVTRLQYEGDADLAANVAGGPAEKAKDAARWPTQLCRLLAAGCEEVTRRRPQEYNQEEKPNT